MAFLDISTGEFHVSEGTFDYIDKLLANYAPKEILLKREQEKTFVELFGVKYYTYKMDEWAFSPQAGRDKLLTHFNTSSLKGFGIEDLRLGTVAAGAALFYLELTQHDRLRHISAVSRIDEDRHVWLDRFTVHNLELFSSPNENARTLVDIMDKTISPMGARLLKRWLSMPLKEVPAINARLNAVDYFLQQPELCDALKINIYEIGDLERIISRVAAGRCTPREMVQLKNALRVLQPVKELCEQSGEPTLCKIGEQIYVCETIATRIEKELEAEPANQIGKGSVIAAGVNAELDELRDISRNGKDYLLDVRQREAERTGITSLKVGFNNVFGYYIEVRDTHKSKVPPEWVRKQTLVGAERYITEELKQYEEKILGAEEKILVLEHQLFNDLVVSLLDYIVPVQLNASLVAQLDCLLSFAELAGKHHYCKPVVNTTDVINIKEGRHPVIEQLLPPGETYVTNDVYVDNNEQQIMIITGPNMSGKSALLRQTALIVLMAQVGCYVPASSAEIGVVDKIFTRVGASDNISQGESTFMVEMNETASILHNLSNRSLILLDEIGRGTSTYDGISIAWAMVEYIHEHPTAKAKTLFATHYHELNEMEELYPRVKNYNVSVKEDGKQVIFLRKLRPGGVAHSFGIHVARMAGMPNAVLNSAEQMLLKLESQRGSHAGSKHPGTGGIQMSIFQLDDPVLVKIREELSKINIEKLSPLEAFDKLRELQKIGKG